MRKSVIDWLTSARDWTDATPKFLDSDLRASEELKRFHADGRRYGGFIVSSVFRRPVTRFASKPARFFNAVSG